MTASPRLGALDEFELIRVLGRGGMGAVYLARDTLLDRLVAIKVMATDHGSAEARRRFLTEARAIARLDHPNVVTVYRAGVTGDGLPYLAQELVRGQALDRVALPVPPRRAIEIAIGLARGLAAAHRRGILHRDVKPANVVLDELGTPRLLDFGLAKLTAPPLLPLASGLGVPSVRPNAAAVEATADVDVTDPGTLDAVAQTVGGDLVPAPPLPLAATATATAEETALTTSDGELLGTPRYLAPERWLGEAASIRSDLYSLGVVMYELLAGVPPFPERDRAALRAAVIAGPPPRSLAACTPELSPTLCQLVDACLDRDPGQRPASADELVYRLEGIVADAPPLVAGNPYPGLAPFEHERRADFFGRGADIAAIVDRLRTESLVAITGDSGTGKSSLARAGVAAAVVAGALDDGRAWQVRSVRVGRAPLAAVRAACGLTADVGAAPSRSELVAALGLGATAGVLLIIDQLEELLTIAPPAEVAPTAALVAALAADVPGVRIVATLRGDFLAALAAVPDLGATVVRGLQVLGPLSTGGIRAAIEGPARARGVTFQHSADGVDPVDALVRAVEGQPGALPLVQFALAALWDRRDPDRAVISGDALIQIGGVAGALAHHADQILAKLAPRARPAARRIVLALVTRAGTRATGSRAELAGDDPDAEVALEALVAGRLVVASDPGGAAPVYQLAHDTLITHWTTLRGWLDDAVGQRGRRARLAAAADEWHRLGRRPQHLWSAAQLAQAAGLDELGDRDRAFVEASRRAQRRRRLTLIAALSALPLIAATTWWSIRAVDARDRDRQVAVRIAAAERALAQAAPAAAAAATTDASLATTFADGPTDDGERAWRAARDQAAVAAAAYAVAATELEAAVVTDDRPALRRRLAAVLELQAAQAEAAGDAAAVAALLARVAVYDPSRLAAWHAPASLVIDAPGAIAIAVQSDDERDGVRELAPAVVPPPQLGQPIALPPGSYRVTLTGADGAQVVAPVWLTRGEPLVVRAPMPRAADIPPGFIYIPSGRFRFGSRDDDVVRIRSLDTSPLHERETAAYLIARDETTYGEWMTYLRTLSPAEREVRRPRTTSTGPRSLSLDGDGPFTLHFQPADAVRIAPEGEPLVLGDRPRRAAVVWERAPVAGVALADAQAYAGWLDATGRVPRARLCTELEWERAARGADGRTYPHGERLGVDDANFDETYDRWPERFGPDEVGAHPASTSPFGVRDLAGNVKEWVIGVGGRPHLRGGGYYHNDLRVMSAGREPAEPTMRLPWLGVRICADPSPG